MNLKSRSQMKFHSGLASVLIAFFGAEAATATELSKQDQIDIIFSERNLYNDPDLRKVVYMASELAKTAKQFQSDPSSLPITRPKREDEAPQMQIGGIQYIQETAASSAPVLQRKREELGVFLDGTSVGQSSTLKVLSTAAIALGQPKLSAALNFGGHGIDRLNPGHDPSLSGVATSGFGDFLTELKSLDPKAYEIVVEEALSRKDLALEADLSNHSDVTAFIERTADRKAHEALAAAVEKVRTGVSALQAQQNKRLKAENAAKLRKDVQAGFGTASMLASLTGNEELGQQISTAGRIADHLLKINSASGQDLSSLGMLAVTQDYVAIATLAVQLVNGSGGSFEDTVINQMQQIMEMIQELSKQIEKEFLVVNEKLDAIDLKLTQLIAEVRQGNQVQVDLLRETLSAIAALEDSNDEARLGEQVRIVSQAKRICIEERSGFDGNSHEIEIAFKRDCLAPLLKASSENITLAALNVRLRSATEIGDYATQTSGRYVLPAVFSSLTRDDIGNHPGIPDANIDSLVDPSVWLEHSEVFLDLLSSYPDKHYLFLEQDFLDIASAGEAVLSANQFLLAENSKRLNWSVIDTLLASYKRDSTDLMALMYSSSEQFDAQSATPKLGLVNAQGFHAAKSFDQENSSARWHPLPNKLGFCNYTAPHYRLGQIEMKFEVSPANVMAGIPAVYDVRNATEEEKSKFLDFNQGFNNHHTRFRFLQLPSNFERYLPNRIKWFLSQTRSGFDVCIAHIRMDKMTGVIAQPAFRRISGAGGEYEGFATINVHYQGKLVASGRFPFGDKIADGISSSCAYMNSMGLGDGSSSCTAIPARAVQTTIFGEPSSSQEVFMRGLENEEFFSDLFFDRWERGWNEQAIGHFSKRNSAYIQRMKSASAKAELLYLAVLLGLNPEPNKRDEILSFIFSIDGLPSPLQLLEKAISDDMAPSEIEELIEQRTVELRKLFKLFENEARGRQVPVFQVNREILDQVEKVNFVKENIHFPAEPVN